jgi:DNA-binding response OmpR family regulator
LNNTGKPKRKVQGKQILLVEDDTDSAEMFMMLLEMEGYQVTWVPTATAVLRFFSSMAGPDGESPEGRLVSPPHLLLLDLTLPDMEVTEMVQRLTESGHAIPPIILMSAKSLQAVEAAAEAIGAVSIVRKPFDLEDLLNGIEAVLNPL